MACCSIVYPRKTRDACSLCGSEMCSRCLPPHFKKHVDDLAMFKMAQALMHTPAKEMPRA